MHRTNVTPPVNCAYGAPLGRSDRPSGEPDCPPWFELQSVPLDSGGYDSGGAYWGIGETLFYCRGGEFESFFRAVDRESAKNEIRKKFPAAEFAPLDAANYDVGSMVDAYLTAMLWTELDDGGNALDTNHDSDDVAADTRERARLECESFVLANESDLADIDADSAGHDLWLTRNRHGVGFWDRGLGDKGDRLTESAHSYGERCAYVGDDGKIHLDG